MLIFMTIVISATYGAIGTIVISNYLDQREMKKRGAMYRLDQHRPTPVTTEPYDIETA